MKVLFGVVILLSIALAADDFKETCYATKFQKDKVKSPKCLVEDETAKTNYVAGCDSKNAKANYCQREADGSGNCIKRPENSQQTKNFVDGSRCDNKDECYSKECKSHRCVGLKENKACTKGESSCQTGFACIKDGEKTTYKCQKQLAKTKACESDEQCQNGLVCNALKCIEAFSLDNLDKTLSKCEKNMSDACVSGQCKTTKVATANVHECIAAATSTSTTIVGTKITTIPIETKDSTKCKASNADITSSISCVKNETIVEGKGAFCGALLGDESGVLLGVNQHKVQGSDQDKCHYKNQLDPYCWYDNFYKSKVETEKAQWDNFKKYYMALEEFINYPSLEEDFSKNKNETLKVYYPSYYAIQYDVDFFKEGGSDGMLLNYFLALIFIFF